MRHTLLTALTILAFSVGGLTTAAFAQEEDTDDEAETPDVVCSYDAYNCSDFGSCAAVMRVFRECSTDVHGLDRDKDGVPCESLCD